ncbi:FliH/SctL family protein [Cohaesibacter celericrescens]|uniref:Uncharacterized protein n=1 Tax=Cohaesibacter celericrescens TaxID=2067669 RepID=A0A2N5XMD7_9HYPH|nr:FliH/SctL family protein [Cohaesibacter celericrescens]PLW75610.1 hypothetical protein C0081_18330 [Cohaesibacter celericrescens]
MSQAARYLFDLDFSASPEPEFEEEVEVIPPEPMITVAEHERLLAAAVEQAQAQGEAKAQANREQLASEESLHVQKKILDETTMVYTEVGLLMQRLERDASNLAFAFASRFAEKLVSQEPKAEIQALLNQVLAPLRKTPHISIRLNDAVAEDISTKVNEQMEELGFEGKLSILPDAAVMPGDCEVEWADGGIGRNLRSAIRQVEQLLEDHFAHVPETEEDQEDEVNDAPEDSSTEDVSDDAHTMTEPQSQDQQPEQTQSSDADRDDTQDGTALPTPSALRTSPDLEAPMDAVSQTNQPPNAEPEAEPVGQLARQETVGDTV